MFWYYSIFYGRCIQHWQRWLLQKHGCLLTNLMEVCDCWQLLLRSLFGRSCLSVLVTWLDDTCLLMFSYVIMEWKSSFPVRYGKLYWHIILHLMFVRCLLSLLFFSWCQHWWFGWCESVVREVKGPFTDPQHPYMYEEDDMWMAPGFIHDYYKVKSRSHQIEVTWWTKKRWLDQEILLTSICEKSVCC